MTDPERPDQFPEGDPATAIEMAWLKEHQAFFFAYARDHFVEQGRGALVVDASNSWLDDQTPFKYAAQARIEEQEDEVSQGLASLVAEYDPDTEFVAVFIRSGIEYEFGMYQIRVNENLIKAMPSPREFRLTQLMGELAQLNQLLGDSDQIIRRDIEAASKRLNGHHGQDD